MPIYFAGAAYAKAYVGGAELKGVNARGQSYFSTASDSAGVITLSVRRASRGAMIEYSITDANGIRAVTSVVMLADDDTRSDVTSEITRSDANTFSGTSRRLNNKWRVGSITIIYVDATSGTSHTLTRSWSV